MTLAPQLEEREVIGATEERWQLTGNKAEESREETSGFIDVDFFSKAMMIQDCSIERHSEGTMLRVDEHSAHRR